MTDSSAAWHANRQKRDARARAVVKAELRRLQAEQDAALQAPGHAAAALLGEAPAGGRRWARRCRPRLRSRPRRPAHRAK